MRITPDDPNSDLNRGVTSELYAKCLKKKEEGLSNTELRNFLFDQSVDVEAAKRMIREVDSDFMLGMNQKKKRRSTIVIAQVIGVILLILGLGPLVFMLKSGESAIIPIIICGGISSTGLGLIGSSYSRKKRSSSRQRMESTYARWKK